MVVIKVIVLSAIRIVHSRHVTKMLSQTQSCPKFFHYSNPRDTPVNGIKRCQHSRLVATPCSSFIIACTSLPWLIICLPQACNLLPYLLWFVMASRRVPSQIKTWRLDFTPWHQPTAVDANNHLHLASRPPLIHHFQFTSHKWPTIYIKLLSWTPHIWQILTSVPQNHLLMQLICRQLQHVINFISIGPSAHAMG